jgi:hypothetical protein
VHWVAVPQALRVRRVNRDRSRLRRLPPPQRRAVRAEREKARQAEEAERQRRGGWGRRELLGTPSADS